MQTYTTVTSDYWYFEPVICHLMLVAQRQGVWFVIQTSSSDSDVYYTQEALYKILYTYTSWVPTPGVAMTATFVDP